MEQGIVPLLGYSKESSNSADDIRDTETEIIRCIEELKTMKTPTFLAIKLSGLSTEEELRRLEWDVQDLISRQPSLGRPHVSEESMKLMNRHPHLFKRLQRMCEAARRSDVLLVLDAEIRFQGEVDSLPTSAILCSLLNDDRPCIWNTHQM